MHLLTQLLAQIHIEITKRLVEQQELWLGGQGTGKGYTLLLAAREFMRIAAGSILQANEVQHFCQSGTAPGSRPPEQPELDVLADSQMRKQGKILKYHTDMALLWWHYQARTAHQSFDKVNFAAVWLFKPGNEAQ